MRPTGRAKVDINDPSCFGQCDRTGKWYNLRDLVWQYEYAGNQLYNTRVLVCRESYDTPNEQLRTIILPPDPTPLVNSRIPDFAYEENTVMITQSADAKGPPWAAGPQQIMCDQTGELALLLQYNTSS